MANKENVKAWVDALQSGEYPQAGGALRNRYGFCCWGVACDLAVKAGVIGEPTVADDGVYTYEEDHDGYPPGAVVGWLGFYYDDGFENTIEVVADPEIPDEKIDVIVLNDTYEFNFNQIGKAIERTFLEEK